MVLNRPRQLRLPGLVVKHRRPFQAGCDARYSGVPRDACPYEDLEGDDWRAG